MYNSHFTQTYLVYDIFYVFIVLSASLLHIQSTRKRTSGTDTSKIEYIMYHLYIIRERIYIPRSETTYALYVTDMDRSAPSSECWTAAETRCFWYEMCSRYVF